MPLKGPLFNGSMPGPMAGEPYVFRTPADEARRLKGRQDDARTAWLRESPEGRALAARLALEAGVVRAPEQPVEPEPEPERLALLPRYEGGEEGWVAPMAAEGVAKAGSLFGRAYRGEPIREDEPMNFAMNVTGGSVIGGRRPKGSVGMGGRVGGDPPEPIEGPLAAPPKLGPMVDRPRPLLGGFESTTPGRIVNQTKENRGYSVSLPTGDRPTEGLMMGQYKNTDPRNRVLEAETPLKRTDVESFVKKNKNALSRDDRYMGTWRSTKDGKTYLDVSKRFNPDQLRKAVKFGERTQQEKGYNVGTGEEFLVGNWKEFIEGPEFQARMDEMAQKGNEYLRQHANKEWWDVVGSSFERVYGPGSVQKVAGLIAATAPNNSPRPNLQLMTEYMRRMIKGEPLIQPDYQIPEGTMSRNTGVQLGMEDSRALNLERIAEGRFEDLGSHKVQEEYQALMGNPNAVVLDRHWARMGEDPNRNIFLGPEEGVITDKAYPVMKEQVVRAAQRAGRDPRDFSADAWTGMRDTIQKHSEAFGVKYQEGSIPGESKSYADHFEDLLQEKADHLGISKQEMEAKLRSGDATLLSALLATPLALLAFKQWQSDQGGGVSDSSAP